jgi:hypothetical protein
MIKPSGTGKPARARAARFRPLPPASSRIALGELRGSRYESMARLYREARKDAKESGIAHGRKERRGVAIPPMSWRTNSPYLYSRNILTLGRVRAKMTISSSFLPHPIVVEILFRQESDLMACPSWLLCKLSVAWMS